MFGPDKVLGRLIRKVTGPLHSDPVTAFRTFQLDPESKAGLIHARLGQPVMDDPQTRCSLYRDPANGRAWHSRYCEQNFRSWEEFTLLDTDIGAALLDQPDLFHRWNTDSSGVGKIVRETSRP